MDAPTSSTTCQPPRAPHQQQQQQGAAAGGAGLDLSKLAADLSAARQVALDLATSAKTSEAMLIALSDAIPEWLQLVQVSQHPPPTAGYPPPWNDLPLPPFQAQSKSRFRQEVSRMRSLSEPRIAALRMELRELRETVAAEMRVADGQLRTLGAVVAGNLGAAVSIAKEVEADAEAGAGGAPSQPGGGGGAASRRDAAPSGEVSSSSGQLGPGTSGEVLRLVEAERRAVAIKLQSLMLLLGGTSLATTATAPEDVSVISLADSAQRLHVSA